MVQINFALKEVNCKIVYYGPGMSGKTTNLEVVHRKAPTANKGELTSIATEGDRTLFFDFMPLDLGNIAGMRTKFQLYTVPGQVYYNSTRKLVLQGVDGIIFVADSQEGKMEENLESMENLRNNLAEYGKVLDQIPMVLQYNKRDLPNVMNVEYMNEKLNSRDLPFFEGVATTGEGVFPTLKALSAQVLESLSKDKRGAGAAPRRRPAPAARSAEESDREAVAAATRAAARSTDESSSRRIPRPAAGQSVPDETFGPESEIRKKIEAAQAQATFTGTPAAPARPPAPKSDSDRSPGRRSPVDDSAPSGLRIRKGVDAFTTSPPDKPPEREAPRDAATPTGPVRTRFSAAISSEAPERRVEPDPVSSVQSSKRWERTRTPPRPQQPQAQSPLIQKFVLEEERGSPLVLIVLLLIIFVAAGVVLYSFDVI